MIRLEISFPGNKGLSNLIRYLENILFVAAEGAVANLSDEIVNNMIMIIEDARKNPSRPGVSKLQNSIDWKELINDPGKELMIGIGEVAKMTREASYWEMINSGAKYVTSKTHVVPTDYFADPQNGFVTFKEGSVHIIEGIDFVGRSLRNLEKGLNKIVIEFGGKILTGAKQASL